MEDAMIINKSSYERGFAYGTIYKANFIDLKEMSTGRKNRSTFEKDSGSDLWFDRDPARPDLVKFLDSDGLPYPGTKLQDGVPYYCFRNDAEGGVYTVKKYESLEEIRMDKSKHFSSKSFQKTTYGFMLKDAKPFRIPIPCKGKLRFFDIELPKMKIKENKIVNDMIEEEFTYQWVGHH